MIANVKVKPRLIKNPIYYNMETEDGRKFPFMIIDKDSYISGATIYSGVSYHWDIGNYNFHIGKYCSLAEDISIMIDVNHGYDGLFTGVVPEIEGATVTRKSTMKPKGQIVIQNDVWIGHGATIMDGVTIHNGAVVGTDAVVTKDVPPYAIVAGNPAKIIKYRFEQDIIDKLLQIAWWDWDSATMEANKDMMVGDVRAFVEFFYEKSLTDKPTIGLDTIVNRITDGPSYVFYMDMEEEFCIWKRVIRQFVEKQSGTNSELILYMNPCVNDYEYKVQELLEELKQYEEYDCYINICSERLDDDSDLLLGAGYFISNRQKLNVHRMCKAELYGTKCLVGVSVDIFQL